MNNKELIETINIMVPLLVKTTGLIIKFLKENKVTDIPTIEELESLNNKIKNLKKL